MSLLNAFQVFGFKTRALACRHPEMRKILIGLMADEAVHATLKKGKPSAFKILTYA